MHEFGLSGGKQLLTIDGTIVQMPPEKLLLRWVNYHLEHAGSARQMSNFSEDVKVRESSSTPPFHPTTTVHPRIL